MNDARTVKVRVKTRSSRTQVEERPDGTLSVHVTSVPERGKANKDVIEALAAHMHIKKRNLEIVYGLKSKDKIIRITK